MAGQARDQLKALDLACQSLAQRAKLLVRTGAVKSPARLRKIDRMVANAIASLEEEITSCEAMDRPKSAGLLLRMLRGKDVPEEGPPPPPRSPDEPPSHEHSLSLRGEGKSIPAPDLLGFLSSQKKTGLLEVVTQG